MKHRVAEPLHARNTLRAGPLSGRLVASNFKIRMMKTQLNGPP